MSTIVSKDGTVIADTENMSVVDNVAANTRSHDAATSTAPKSNSNPLEAYVKIAKEASKLYGDSAAGLDRGLTALTGATSLLYQTDDYYRSKIDSVIKTRGPDAKNVSKTTKEAAMKWFHLEFELVKPAKGARAEGKFKFNNRETAHFTAFKRAADYYKQGFRFTVDAKTKKIFVTSDSYRKVTGDKTNVGDVEVVAKASATSDKLTFASIMSNKPTKDTKGKAGEKIVVSATAANFKVLCAAAEKAALETVEPDKMDGSTQLAAFQLYITIGNLIGAKNDAAIVKRTEEIMNDSARKAA